MAALKVFHIIAIIVLLLPGLASLSMAWPTVGLLPGSAYVLSSEAPAIDRYIANAMKFVYGNRLQIADGTAADAAKINTAINAGKHVVLSEGRFNIASQIYPITNTWLSGQGDSTVLSVAWSFTSYAVIWDDYTVNGVKISDFKIAGNKGNPASTGSCITLQGATYTTLENLWVDNCAYFGIFFTRLGGLYTRQSDGIFMDKVRATNNGWSGMAFTADNIQGSNILSKYNGTSGISFEDARHANVTGIFNNNAIQGASIGGANEDIFVEGEFNYNGGTTAGTGVRIVGGPYSPYVVKGIRVGSKSSILWNSFGVNIGGGLYPNSGPLNISIGGDIGYNYLDGVLVNSSPSMADKILVDSSQIHDNTRYGIFYNVGTGIINIADSVSVYNNGEAGGYFRNATNPKIGGYYHDNQKEGLKFENVNQALISAKVFNNSKAAAGTYSGMLFNNSSWNVIYGDASSTWHKMAVEQTGTSQGNSIR